MMILMMITTLAALIQKDKWSFHPINIVIFYKQYSFCIHTVFTDDVILAC